MLTQRDKKILDLCKEPATLRNLQKLIPGYSACYKRVQTLCKRGYLVLLKEVRTNEQETGRPRNLYQTSENVSFAADS